LTSPLTKSVDGSKTFAVKPLGHIDIHDVWINPDNLQNMIIGFDGGAERILLWRKAMVNSEYKEYIFSTIGIEISQYNELYKRSNLPELSLNEGVVNP
jgi:hypothetical protein